MIASANAWAIVLILLLLWGRDRARQWKLLAAYFGGLALLGLVGGFTPQALAVGEITIPAVAVPVYYSIWTNSTTAFLLLLLNRRIRAIGPILFLGLLIAAIGPLLGIVLGGSLLNLVTMLLVESGAEVTSAVYGPDVLAILVALLIFSWPTWLAVRWLAQKYRRKKFSEQMLTLSVVVFVLSAERIVSHLAAEASHWGWLYLASFVVFVAVTWFGLRPLQRAAAERPNPRLLLLRVFGSRRRSERFFDLLGARWRYAGSIRLIAGTDLATSSLDPGRFLDFLGRRLRQTFINTPDDLDQRLASMDLLPDPDGRFRINEFLCAREMWQAAVSRLMPQSDIVAMDLRGFSRNNQGCLFEIQALFNTVPADRLVFVVDKSTDYPFLHDTMLTSWHRMIPLSPNRTGGSRVLRILKTRQSDVAAVRWLMQIGDDLMLKTADYRLAP